MLWLAKLIAGPLVGKIIDLVTSYQGRKLGEAELRAEVERAVLGTFAEVSKSQASVIETEMRGENWMQRNWRPIVALGLSFIIFFYGIITPVLVSWFDFPPVRVGDQLLSWIMDAVIICLGGYIGGRTLEKVVKMVVRG